MDITDICSGTASATELRTAIAALDDSQVDDLIDKATDPAVPVVVLFAALERLLRGELGDTASRHASSVDPHLWTEA